MEVSLADSRTHAPVHAVCRSGRPPGPLARPGIYVITCTATGHSYIGSAKHIGNRISHYKRYLRRGICHSPVLQFAHDVFGAEAFKYEVLEFCEVDQLAEREKFYLTQWPGKLFNILKDGRRPR